MTAGFTTPVKTSRQAKLHAAASPMGNKTPARFCLSPNVRSPCKSRRSSAAFLSPRATKAALAAAADQSLQKRDRLPKEAPSSSLACNVKASTATVQGQQASAPMAAAVSSRATRKVKTYDRFIPSQAELDSSQFALPLPAAKADAAKAKQQPEYLCDAKIAYQQRVAQACGVCLLWPFH